MCGAAEPFFAPFPHLRTLSTRPFVQQYSMFHLTDLYGHEEAPVAPEQEETVSLESPQETQQEAPPPPTKQPVKPTPAPAAPTVPATSSIPSYSSPPTHQIPTYEERQTAEFAGPSDAGHDGGFEGDYEDGADGDRPVRPSEMKEEG